MRIDVVKLRFLCYNHPMKYVYYDSLAPSSFEEQSYLSKDIPYVIKIKTCAVEDHVPLHYSKTMEILLCDRVEGTIMIDANNYVLAGRQAFIIPPKAVHSLSAVPSNGTMYVLKIDFEMLKNYVDLPALFAYGNKAFSAIPFVCEDPSILFQIAEDIIRQEDMDIFDAVQRITALFKVIFDFTPENTTHISSSSSANRMLRTLITWTEQNYNRKIRLEEVADVIGYSKYYFCSTFRSLTGVTYINYLNSVRLSHACSQLLEGRSVSETCYSCGFEDVSYFVQLFKRTYHLTPQQYKKKLGVKQSSASTLQ